MEIRNLIFSIAIVCFESYNYIEKKKNTTGDLTNYLFFFFKLYPFDLELTVMIE